MGGGVDGVSARGHPERWSWTGCSYWFGADCPDTRSLSFRRQSTNQDPSADESCRLDFDVCKHEHVVAFSTRGWTMLREVPRPPPQ